MKNKKGQIAGQIFIYIIAVVVVGLIVVYGYSAIKSFKDRGEEVEYITLKTNIENSVKNLASDFGSIKRPDFRVPVTYTAVCFSDKTISAEAFDAMPLCDITSPDYWPIACEGAKTGRNNAFLMPDGSEAFDVGDIELADSTNNFQKVNSLCIPVINGKLNMQLKGLGDKVQISYYEK